MVCLVTVTQTGQDLHGVFYAGLFHLYRLETPLQGRIFFNIFTVFLSGGGANGLQFPPRQHGLEDRGRVNRTFCGARPHQGVDLVDEQNNVAAGADFFQNFLQALLEVAAVT